MNNLLLGFLILVGSMTLEERECIKEYNFFETQESPLVFPSSFLKGVGRSFYQDGGHNTWQSLPQPTISNWTTFAENSTRLNARTCSLFKQPTILDNQKVGISSDGWNRAFDDIKLIKDLHCNAQRFSVEWSEIEPFEGQFNQEALSFYERYCDALIAQGIQPMLTLHHFVHPQWFQEKGGFEKEENIHYFVRYAQKVFDRLGGKVKLWCTINEPTVVASCGYILGIHAPGQFLKFHMAGRVLKHLLQAHVATYNALKQMPHGQSAQIGIVHQMLNFEPYRYAIPFGFNINNPIGVLTSRIFNASFGHTTVKRFFQTGQFSFKPLPFVAPIVYTDQTAPRSNDFIGLNYYSKVIIGMGPTKYDHQTMTDMEYAIRPDTLYNALHDMAALGKPIYITETGIADQVDNRRGDFIQSYMNAIYHAMQDGVDVRGVFYWSLLDNFEWNEGFSKKFGLYRVDPITQERTLRSGACRYRDYVIRQTMVNPQFAIAQ